MHDHLTILVIGREKQEGRTTQPRRITWRHVCALSVTFIASSHKSLISEWSCVSCGRSATAICNVRRIDPAAPWPRFTVPLPRDGNAK